MRVFYKVIFFVLLFLSISLAKADSSLNEQDIRLIVKELLQEKDSKIQLLESRIQQLEAKLKNQNASVNVDKTTSAIKDQKAIDNSFSDKLAEIESDVSELKSTAAENGLEITGFFDFSARTENSEENTFSLGAVEIDLEYAYGEHFAASSALVWDGDSAEIGVAVVDFHMFDDAIPARGRIFSSQGFHVQAGRFDLPFSTDYQYFAAPDRMTVSAPMTTERIQQGGYNGDGVRFYGSWNIVNYAAFWTNSVYEDEGTSVGGRLGISLGQNSYQLHNQHSNGNLEVGISHLTDLDGSDNARNSIYAADLTFNYGLLALQSELAWLESHETLFDANDVNLGRPDEFSYHVTLIADLATVVLYPVKTYIRYGQWNPSHSHIVDGDESYAIEDISRLTVGFNYTMNDYLQIKFEYSDSLGTETEESDFEKQLGTAQLVVAF